MTDPRGEIRKWWKARIAGSPVIDLDKAAGEATALLMADPAFVERVGQFLVKPLIREMGEKMAKEELRKNGGAVQLGNQVMTRAHAAAMVRQSVLEHPPDWRKWQIAGKGVTFWELDRVTVMAEAIRLRDEGRARLHDAAFLLKVAEAMKEGQIVAEVWPDTKLDELYQRVDVRLMVGLKAPEQPVAIGGAA